MDSDTHGHGLSAAGLRRIDEHLMKRYIEPGKIAGALTVVARHCHVAWFSPRGLSDLERKKAMAQDTIFRIYSMTKPITSVALMMLEERGLVALADRVDRYIPAFKNLQVYKSGR